MTVTSFAYLNTVHNKTGSPFGLPVVYYMVLRALCGAVIGVVESRSCEGDCRGANLAMSLLAAVRAENLRFLAHWVVYFKGIVAICAMIIIACHVNLPYFDSMLLD